MKRKLLIIGNIVLIVLILALALSIVVPKIRQSGAEKKILGTWSYVIEEGYATAYYTFSESGELTSYYDITNLPEGASLDTSKFGTVTYAIEHGNTLVLNEGIMGIGQVERFSLRFSGNDTMYIDGVEYTRVKD